MDPAKRNIYAVAAASFLIIIVAIYFLFINKKGLNELETEESGGEVRELTDLKVAERPFVTLTPTSDGAEIIMTLENMAKFDRIEYGLSYLADNPGTPGDKIDRGALGSGINTKEPKYKHSHLLGTASRGVRSPDTGIVEGKLTLHLFVGEVEYRSESEWDLVQISSQPSTIEARSGSISLQVPKAAKDYWVIIADTVGAPPNPQGFTAGDVILPVFGTFSIAPEFKTKVQLSITPKESAGVKQLYSYDHNDSTWQKLESEASGHSLTASVSNFATYVVVGQ